MIDFNQNTNFGFVRSEIDGTEIVFGVPKEQKHLPQTYSYKRFMPKIINQGAESICVPCSISAYINWKENLYDGSRRDNKVDYHEIYNCRTNQGDGMSFKEAFHFLRHNGVTTKIGNKKINRYAWIEDYSALKFAIITNGPCVGALPVFSWRDEFWKKQPGDGFFGYHAIAIIGYNKDGYIIRNSWGEDYGNKGYSVLKYEDLNNLIEAWTII